MKDMFGCFSTLTKGSHTAAQAYAFSHMFSGLAPMVAFFYLIFKN